MHKFFKSFLFFLILINIDIVSANTINQTSTLLNSTSAFTNKPNISAGSSVVIDANSDTILYNKNMNKKIYPASTTKILTAIIAIEKLNLDDTITVRKEELELVPEDSSIMYLQEGEVISVRDLLYGLMLKSGNDAANVLAYEVSGNLTDFVSLMNEKVKELHCTNTHFTNAHGFHDDNHYSTSIDMANILKYCIKNELFKEITQTKKYKIEKTNKLPARYLTNTNNLVKNNYEFKIGGKTGFTNEAGNVLVSYAIKDDVEVVLTLYDGTKKMSDRLVKFDETLNLLNYTFDNFSKKTILKKETINLNYVDNVDDKIYNLKLNNDIISLISKENYILKYNVKKENDQFKLYLNVKNNNFEINNIYNLDINNITKINKFKLEYLILIPIFFILILVLFKIITNNIKFKKRRKNRKKYSSSLKN